VSTIFEMVDITYQKVFIDRRDRAGNGAEGGRAKYQCSDSVEGLATRISDKCGPSIVHGLDRQFARHCLANLHASRFLRHFQVNPRLGATAGHGRTHPTGCPRLRRHFRCHGPLRCGCCQLRGVHSRNHVTGSGADRGIDHRSTRSMNPTLVVRS